MKEITDARAEGALECGSEAGAVPESRTLEQECDPQSTHELKAVAGATAVQGAARSVELPASDEEGWRAERRGG